MALFPDHVLSNELRNTGSEQRFMYAVNDRRLGSSFFEIRVAYLCRLGRRKVVFWFGPSRLETAAVHAVARPFLLPTKVVAPMNNIRDLIKER